MLSGRLAAPGSIGCRLASIPRSFSRFAHWRAERSADCTGRCNEKKCFKDRIWFNSSSSFPSSASVGIRRASSLYSLSSSSSKSVLAAIALFRNCHQAKRRPPAVASEPIACSRFRSSGEMTHLRLQQGGDSPGIAWTALGGGIKDPVYRGRSFSVSVPLDRIVCIYGGSDPGSPSTAGDH